MVTQLGEEQRDTIRKQQRRYRVELRVQGRGCSEQPQTSDETDKEVETTTNAAEIDHNAGPTLKPYIAQHERSHREIDDIELSAGKHLAQLCAQADEDSQQWSHTLCKKIEAKMQAVAAKISPLNTEGSAASRIYKQSKSGAMKMGVEEAQLASLEAYHLQQQAVINELKELRLEAETSFAAVLRKQGERYFQMAKRFKEDRTIQVQTQLQEEKKFEESFASFRDSMADTEASAMNLSFDKRVGNHLDIAERRVSSIQTSEHAVLEMNKAHSEELQQQKKRLETGLQRLMEVLERIKGCVLLNAEKLDYNVRVLSEREEENQKVLGAQKRRLTRLKDALSRNMKQFQEVSATLEQKNWDLTVDLKNLTLQEQDIQDQYRQFKVTAEKTSKDAKELFFTELSALGQLAVQLDALISKCYGTKTQKMASIAAPSSNRAGDQVAASPSNAVPLQPQANFLEQPCGVRVLKQVTEAGNFLLDPTQNPGDVLKFLNAGSVHVEDLSRILRHIPHQLEHGGGGKKLLTILQEQVVAAQEGSRKVNKKTTRASLTPKTTLVSEEGLSLQQENNWAWLKETLQKYYRMIEVRHRTSTRCLMVSKETDRLRNEVKWLLTSNRNKDLLIPPPFSLSPHSQH